MTAKGDLVCTGAAGFLGSELVRRMAARGLCVRGLVRGDQPSIKGVTFCRGDIQDPQTLRAAFAGARTVVHAAALAHVFDERRRGAALFKAVNEIGTANVVRAAVETGVGHVVLVSSVAVYGGGRDADEHAPCRPVGAYATSKWQAEQRAFEIAEATRLPITVLRLATVYGEGDRGNVARLMRALDRRRFMWIGDGRNRKSLIHREDAASAVLLAAGRSPTGTEIYNVAVAPCSMREVVDTLSDALGRPRPRRAVPTWMARAVALASLRIAGGRGPVGALGTAVTKWLADDAYDGSRFATTFGFHPDVSLREGLRREVAWYRRESGKAAGPSGRP